MAPARIPSQLEVAVASAPDPLAAADHLCRACVTFLDVDGASMSLINGEQMGGTLGSSGRLRRTLDELEYALGEGPCVGAVVLGDPVRVEHVHGPGEQRWPALSGAYLSRGVLVVWPAPMFAMCLAAPDLFCGRSGSLGEQASSGGSWAARSAARPLLDLMTADVDWLAAGASETARDQLASLGRVEVQQATGFFIGALGSHRRRRW